MKKKRFVVLVCGGREFKARKLLFNVLDYIHNGRPFTKVVQGYARGADRLAHDWAVSREVPNTNRQYEITPAMWEQMGYSAGYLRNKAMRDGEQPDLVVAFPGGNGTDMMVNLAKQADIDYVRVRRDGRLLWHVKNRSKYGEYDTPIYAAVRKREYLDEKE